jgi:hypothetical protein
MVVLTYNTEWSVLVARECGRVVSTFNVCRVAKCVQEKQRA